MSRYIYPIKTGIVIAVLVVAIASTRFGPARSFNAMAHLHYGAAATVEAALNQSPAKLSQAFLALVHEYDCVRLGGF